MAGRSTRSLDRTKMHRGISTAITTVAISSLSWAGGSFEPVMVQSLRIVNDTEYELVVVTDKSRDAYFAACETFTVLGTYSPFHSWLYFPSFVNVGRHKQALSRLQEAHKRGIPINFGAMGSGFEPIDPRKPCVVRSRALDVRGEPDSLAVISYYGAV